ncbi:hypothetical protein B0G71_1397 [Paraburkholderia sp. BL27I4N3]|uniref:hypothetical protein n=1 Tax=Paraburkholderia sp. BL27I4N3 TaxID=1938805 RepID=UPI000E25E944|nr:hypothetical protein [Paraburkholderia sp. BL27I4N3]REE18385.1 hypothetical protein B0G71_1397 [Paraburkholderia sp. BL27I4N3]
MSRVCANPLAVPLSSTFGRRQAEGTARFSGAGLRASHPATAIYVLAMKARITQAALVGACLAGVTGCVTTQTYNSVKAHGWTRDSIERQFPAGTDRKKVFAKMGNPFRELSADGATWWIYSGGGSGEDQVTFIFRNGKLGNKKPESMRQPR